MRLRIALDGRDCDVLVEGEPPEVRVTVDGRTVPVRVSVDGTTAKTEVEGRTITLDFGGGVRVNGAPRVVEVAWVADETGIEGAGQVVDVRPPMPGRIVRVLVRVDEPVRRGAPLLILEAMKMQNEIPAPVAGTVREVRVKEGDAVTAGDVLVRLAREARGKG